MQPPHLQHTEPKTVSSGTGRVYRAGKHGEWNQRGVLTESQLWATTDTHYKDATAVVGHSTGGEGTPGSNSSD